MFLKFCLIFGKQHNNEPKNVLVEVFALVDFDVTETLAVQSTPAVSPEIEMLFTEEVLEIELRSHITVH